jgi:hypothetical protein
MIRPCGCHRDTTDPRDHVLSSRDLLLTTPPPAFSFEPCVDFRFDQEQTSSCVLHAFSTAFILALDFAKQRRIIPSRSALYYWAREVGGNAYMDDGTSIRNAIKAAKLLGIPEEDSWPWHKGVTDKPSWAAYRSAADRRMLSGYRRIEQGDEERVKICIASKMPVIFGIPVNSAFMDLTTRDVWDFSGRSEGNHAMCAIGYDSDSVTIVNSWRLFGDNGVGRISWPTFNRFAFDLWTISLQS